MTPKERLLQDSLTNPDDEYCTECSDECTGKWVDFGIGPGEAWGQKFCDVKMAYVSNCCEAEVIKNGQLYEGPNEAEKEADYGDYLHEQEKDRRLMEQLEEEER